MRAVFPPADVGANDDSEARMSRVHAPTATRIELMRRLPPFAELVAFEAVARHLSFTRASQELCITQSAVSHRIRRLEQHFGTPLIRRLNPGLALTERGVALLPGLAAALDGLSRLGSSDERRLRVAAGSPLCTWWLAGRLSGFIAQRPGVSVDLVPIESLHAPIPEVDVRILWVGPGEDLTGPRQARLFAEYVFPVCSPKLLPDGLPLRDAQQLAGLALLHKTANATGEWSWSVWLDRLGVQPSVDAGAQRRSELRLADMGLVMVSGRLAFAVADVEPMVSVKKHVARWPSAKASDADVKAFVEWLVAEAGRTLVSTEQLIRC
jgi:LysR family transcriptional regulator, glycine cleavage system transcriptional activator